MVAVPFGIVGARLYHVITDYELYFGPTRRRPDRRAEDLARRARASGARSRSASLGAYLVARRRKLAFPALLDAVRPGHRGRPGASAGSATGSTRSCSAGRPPCRGAWRSRPSYRPAGYEQYATFHPTFLYELIWNLLVALALVLLDRRFRLGHGKVFALYVVLLHRSAGSGSRRCGSTR